MLKYKIKAFFDLLPATPIVPQTVFAENLNSEPKFYFKSFGSLNSEILFYVIQRSPGAGFFSNLTFVLNHIYYANLIGAIPIIDNENFPNLYNENRSNSWEAYFQQVSDFKLDEVYQSKNVLVTSEEWPRSFKMSICDSPFLKQVYDLNISLNAVISNELDLFYNSYFKNKRIIGVHFRGKEQRMASGHPFPPTRKQIVNFFLYYFSKNDFDNIFLVTESKKDFSWFKYFFGSKLLYFDSLRGDKNIYNYYTRVNHRYLLGKEILIEAILLSKCHFLLCGGSNVSEFAKFLSSDSNTKIIQIDNGINSKNPLISKVLWRIKSFLPRYLLGFDNEIYKRYF